MFSQRQEPDPVEFGRYYVESVNEKAKSQEVQIAALQRALNAGAAKGWALIQVIPYGDLGNTYLYWDTGRISPST